MSKMPIKMKTATSPLLVAMILLLAFGTFSVAQERQYSKKAWSFGVMGDTQWTLGGPGNEVDPEGTNPNFVAASLARQIYKQFIDRRVKFVVHMGDITNWGGDDGIATVADTAGDLYRHGIGYFPMRGNHETYGHLFPGRDDAMTHCIPAFQANFPQTRGLGWHTFGAKNFSSPTDVHTDLDGMSYSFDFGPSGSDARFVILDVMATKSSYMPDWNTFLLYGYPAGIQQGWISNRLDKNARGTEHAFVFTHQPLMGENHYDTIFGPGYTSADIPAQNAFIASLQDNDVEYYIGAHDHMHQRSIIASPDGLSKVETVIIAPASSKFYEPKDVNYYKWEGQKVRETSLSEELNNVGYYIYTIDGPRVTVEYYSDDDDLFKSDSHYPNDTNPVFEPNVTPKFNFALKETWGYSLNGKEFLIMQGKPYTTVADSFNGTNAQVLSGVNGSTSVDAGYPATAGFAYSTGRRLTKKVTTGWTEATYRDRMLISDILSLWGMDGLGSDRTDTYTLSLTYKYKKGMQFANGKTGIATVDSNGDWVNAVDMNRGGTKKFVLGPWETGYELGTYGVDPATGTAWAVINYNADFAVSLDIHPAVPGHCRDND